MSCNLFIDQLYKFENIQEGQIFKLNELKVISLIGEARKLFFNNSTYKWSLKNAQIFIQQNNVNPIKFIGFLEYLLVRYHREIKIEKGKKGAIQFLGQLRSSQKIQQLNWSETKIQLNPEYDVLDFLHEMKMINKYVNLSHDKMSKFIFENFNLGLSESTIRRYYFDNQK